MLFTMNNAIWLYPVPIDFRKQIDALIILVADHLQMDPTSSQLFLFRDRSAKKIKILWWDRSGFWLLYKRLEAGRFKFPSTHGNVIELTRDQVGWLLTGLDCMHHPLLPQVKAQHFF